MLGRILPFASLTRYPSPVAFSNLCLILVPKVRDGKAMVNQRIPDNLQLKESECRSGTTDQINRGGNRFHIQKLGMNEVPISASNKHNHIGYRAYLRRVSTKTH